MSQSVLSRRRFLVGFGVGLAAVMAAACAPKTAPAPTAVAEANKPSQPSAQPTSQAAAAPASQVATQVVLWSSFSGKNGEAETALVNKFNESQDKVKLDYQFQGSYEECAQKLTAALQARTAPDVCLLSDVWWFKFYLNKALAPLDELLSLAKVDVNQYQDSLINEGVRKGVHYWVPFARSTPLFYYNRDMWQAAGLPDRGPETWAEFTEWAPKLLKKEGSEIKTAAFVHPDGASYIAWIFQAVAWQYGGKYSDPDFTMHMTHAETVRAGQFYADTVHKYGWAKPVKDIGADFINGLTAATIMSTGSMGGVRANAKFNFGTAFLPQEKNFGCCTGGAGLAILAGAPDEHKQAGMEYVAFASNAESTSFWAMNTGYMPGRKDALETKTMQDFFTEFPQFRTAVDQLPKTQPQDAARVFVPNGDQIIGKGLEKITVQNGAVADAFAEVNKILEQEAKPIVEALKAVEG